MRIHSINRLVEKRLKASTKPFNARGSKVDRCLYCRVEKKYCICNLQPDVDTDIAVLILMSNSEVLKPSNTGRLIADVVKETYVYEWNRTEPEKALTAMLSSDEYFPVVVFPDEYVEDKTRLLNNIHAQQSNSESNTKKWLLIFIDSNWREARKIFRKSPYLDGLPVLSFHPDSISEYLMRKTDKDNQLSTAEVAQLALLSLGENNAAKTLDMWFKLFRESYLLSKTRLKRDFSRPAYSEYVQFQQEDLTS